MMDVLYYYYYLFYKKCKVETQPQLTTISTLSLFITWDIIIPINIISIAFLHISIINRWSFIGLFICVAFTLYMYFIKSKRGLKIIEQKPMLCSNNNLSIIFTIGFTLLSIVIIIWGAFFSKELL